MEKSMYRAKVHSDLLLRVFDLPRRGMTRALAESIMALDFPERDAARIEELNARANEGTLTDEEEGELEAYLNINDLRVLAVEGSPNPPTAGMSEVVEAVRRRAGGRCEYCRLPQAAFHRAFHIEHIVA